MRLPSTLISAMRTPSLKASTAWPRSRADRPLSASFTRSGSTRTSGSPSVSAGRGRIRFPSRGDSAPMVRKNTCRPVAKIVSRSGPEMSIPIDRPVPIDRPNSEGWKTNPKVPGSSRAGVCIIGIRSAAFWSSTWRAAMKARPRSATKKKRSITFCASSVPGGCVRPLSASASSDQCLRVFSSTPRAMVSVVSRL